MLPSDPHLVRMHALRCLTYPLVIVLLFGALPQSAHRSVASRHTPLSTLTDSTRQHNVDVSGGITLHIPGPLLLDRQGHSATRLADGTVLIVGGTQATAPKVAEVFDPATGRFTQTGQPNIGLRSNHTATLLPDGDVLIAGGSTGGLPALSSTERYSPSSGTFTASDPMQTGREGHTATALPNGQVLLVGGYSLGAPPEATAELYDPATGSFSATGSLIHGRANHTATLLPDGQVLITGGEGGQRRSDGGIEDIAINQAELYDPQTGMFRPAGTMVMYRDRHAATLLSDGRVLLTGGIDWANMRFLMTSAEIYDPVTGTFQAVSPLHHGRQDHTATLLPSGRVLIVGGAQTAPCVAAEVFDPTTEQFIQLEIEPLNRARHQATSLTNGDVLLTGGVWSTTVEILREETFVQSDATTPCSTTYLPTVQE
jgi:hypothetical protein